MRGVGFTHPAALVAAAEAALDAAGAVIRPYFRAGVQADRKGDESPVTVADRKAEETLREILSAQFPELGIIGEEFPAVNADARYVWVIDPIDGTRAFITGRPNFCTLLGLLEDGVPVAGWIDQPVTGERWRGGRDVAGSFVGKFGGVLGTSGRTDIAEAELSATSPAMFDAAQFARFQKLERACRRVYWGGDAYAFGLLAIGCIDVVAECDLKIWDWAALAPVVQAAGGVISDWNGAALRAGCDGTVLAAATPDLHKAALAALG